MKVCDRVGILFLLMALMLAPLPSVTAADPDQPGCRRGLAAHYFKDIDEWDGNWPSESNVPFADPVNWTFTTYRYSRVEPLINHLFIRQGWFSIRWVGWFDPAPGAHARDEQDYVFEIWADDGVRLFLDGRRLIDDWVARCEDSPAAWRRSSPVRLGPGKHRLVVEYFQGLSEQDDDSDPMKLYWSSPSRGFTRQIIPASHFHHTTDDLRQRDRPMD